MWVFSIVKRGNKVMRVKGQSVLLNAEVYLIKGFGLNTDKAFKLFKALPDWKHAYGKSGRKEITMGKDYTFSGELHKSVAWNEHIKRLMLRINTEFNIDMNSAYLNYYTNGNDSLGYHTDKEPQVDHINQPVVSISYGASRTFWFKDIASKVEYPVVLQDGDLCIMGKDSQLKYQHCVKKEPMVGGDERISITFRHLKF